jgi:hypothetical protein
MSGEQTIFSQVGMLPSATPMEEQLSVDVVPA